MELAGLCAVCGKPARYSCPLCGKLVCETHFEGGACTVCGGGRSFGAGRKYGMPQAKLKLPLGAKGNKA